MPFSKKNKETKLSKLSKYFSLPIYIYIHICCLANWVTILNNLMNNIYNSGLYSYVTEIRCVILGNITIYPSFFNDIKVKIVGQNSDISLYERITLTELWEDSQKEDFYVLYLHTKGVTRQGNQKVVDWVNYMLYFNCYKFPEIITLLKTNNAVGVNLNKQDNMPLHFSGNFWWSKSSYIRKLNKTIGPKYLDPELWITTAKLYESYVGLWLSNIIHYKKLYPKELYINKGIKPYYNLKG